VLSKYSSKNQVAVLIALFTEYNISGNIRYFMANNAELNNTCINAIL